MLQMHSPEQAATWLRLRVRAQLHSDSRRVQTGDGFFAWAGQNTDARHHVVQALQQGASACLVEADGLEAFEALNDLGLHEAPIVSYQGLKAASGAIADAYFDRPSKQLHGSHGYQRKNFHSLVVGTSTHAIGPALYRGRDLGLG